MKTSKHLTSIVSALFMITLLVPMSVWAGDSTVTIPPAAGSKSDSTVTIPPANNSDTTATIPPGQQPAGSNGTQTFTLSNPLNSKFTSVGALVQGFVEIFSYVVVILAVLMIIWVGMQFVLAQGKPDRLKELGTRLTYIVIGVAIVIGARLIINVVINSLGAAGVNSNLIQSARDAANGK